MTMTVTPIALERQEALRRHGTSDMWTVPGAWDLTEVEREVLKTRLNG